MTPKLLDVNVVLALLHAGHAKSSIAAAWLERQSGVRSLLIPRVVVMGALRLSTRAAVMGEDVRSATEFWQGWDRLMEDERFAEVPEPPEMDSAWRTLCGELPPGRCAETDVYLAAFALAGGYGFATFDRGFPRPSGLEVQIL